VEDVAKRIERDLEEHLAAAPALGETAGKTLDAVRDAAERFGLVVTDAYAQEDAIVVEYVKPVRVTVRVS
jgi:hypothetical protein